MTRPEPPSRPSPRKGPRRPRPLSDLLPATLKALGLPSAAATERYARAWALAADPAWVDRTRLRSLEGGVLTIGVASAPLKSELENFHRPRLLQVLKAALPNSPLVGLRFVADAVPGDDE